MAAIEKGPQYRGFYANRSEGRVSINNSLCLDSTFNNNSLILLRKNSAGSVVVNPDYKPMFTEDSDVYGINFHFTNDPTKEQEALVQKILKDNGVPATSLGLGVVDGGEDIVSYSLDFTDIRREHLGRLAKAVNQVERELRARSV